MLIANSLERLIVLFLSLVNLLVLGLTIACLILLDVSELVFITQLMLLLPLQWLASFWLKKKLVSPLYRLSYALESIRVDDYSVSQLPEYSHGVVKRIFDEINDFSMELRKKKRLFDEKNILVHSLIKQLDSPVLLLNNDGQLIHGNKALSRWLGKDWHLVRLRKVTSLGLVQSELGWFIKHKQQTHQFKIRSSYYKDESGEHQLLIFTDISHELRKMQTESWQQIVRVLSHEIKNSLTPIQSMAQTLAEFNADIEQIQMLDIINTRCQNLTEFIERYSLLTSVYNLDSHNKRRQKIDLSNMLSSIIAMYSDVAVELQITCSTVVADPVLLEQVIINLMTNAQQAILLEGGEGVIKVSVYNTSASVILNISDNGIGIQNPDNLFIPFYTTKPDGQGIGLLLSRHIIEQHHGQLTLENNPNSSGATACITLPLVSSIER